MMDIEWSVILELFGLAIAAALIAGAVCPLVGTFLYLRRTSFYGIALPQFAAAGVACGFAVMPWWVEHVGIGDLDLRTAMEDSHEAMNYHLAWAGLFTFGGMGTLVWLGRKGGSEVARVAAAFAMASAATVLFAHSSPTGEIFVHGLLRGEILAVGPHELETIGAVLGLALLAILWFHRDLLIVCYDSESARVLGKPVVRFELLLFAIIGLTVSVGVMTVGPVVLFGLLVLPPVAARPFSRTMAGFYCMSSGVGLASAFAGVWASFRFDWPLGPAVVAAASVLLALSWLLGPRS